MIYCIFAIFLVIVLTILVMFIVNKDVCEWNKEVVIPKEEMLLWFCLVWDVLTIDTNVRSFILTLLVNGVT